MEASGGPVTKDNTGTEFYCTIFAFAESPIKRGLFWAGSDDGLIHISQDGGITWNPASSGLAPGNYALTLAIDAAMSCPPRVSSATVIAEAIDESLSIMIIVLP